jgi:hypothetical protein
VFVSVRLTHGTLISGALANRMTKVGSGRWYRLPPSFGGAGVGRRSRGAGVGSDTLLGPEETGQIGAAAVGWRPRGLLRDVDRGRVPFFLVCGTGLPSHRFGC